MQGEEEDPERFNGCATVVSRWSRVVRRLQNIQKRSILALATAPVAQLDRAADF
jgi:hypothetical protein